MIDLAKHLGHEVYVARYNYDDNTSDYVVECMNCMEIIINDREINK